MTVVSLFALAGHTNAAWPMNTPDRQWNVRWAGENMVWNDNRLGEADIFIRHHNGVVAPLISGNGNHELLTASARIVAYTQQYENSYVLNIFDLANNTVQTVQQARLFQQASAWQNELAWTDGTMWFLYRSGHIFNRMLPSDAQITAFGLTWLEANDLHYWNGETEGMITCAGCQSFVVMGNEVAAKSFEQVMLLPSRTVINLPSIESMSANDNALLLWQHNTSYLWRDNTLTQIDFPIDAKSQLGNSGLVYEQNNDIQLYEDRIPTLENVQHDGEQALMRYFGTSSGTHIEIVLTGKLNQFIKKFNVVNEQWSGQVFDDNTPEDNYKIFAYAVSLFGQKSSQLDLGSIEIDHSTPQLNNAVTISNTVSSAQIKFETNEKTTSHVELKSADEIEVRDSHRLTFKHTVNASDLDPDTDYDVVIEAKDAAANSLRLFGHFKTQSLLASSVNIQKFDTQVDQGVWEGIVLVEPGVIDDKKVIIYNPSIKADEVYTGCKCVLLTWTLGKPPPLKRGDNIRFLASWNNARTALLLHRSKAAAVISNVGEPPIITITDVENSGRFIWVKVTGELTSVTKTSWKIIVSGHELQVHWEHPSGQKLLKHDVATVTGFLHIERGEVVLAADDARAVVSAVADNVQPKLVDTEIPIKNVQASQVQLANVSQAAHAPTSILRSSILEDKIESGYDKSHNLWYNFALLVSAGVIIVRFFFFSPKKP